MIQKKSLATAAGLSLLLSAFSSAPALAADAILTEVDSGTSTLGVVSADGSTNFFELRTTTNSSSASSLKYRILNPSGAEIHVSVAEDGASGTLHETDADSLINYATKANDATGDADSTTLTDFIVKPADASTAAAGVNSDDNILALSVDGATSAVTITVTAWLDTVAASSDRVDSVELVGEPVSITFHPLTDLTWSTAISPIARDASVTAVVTVSPQINGNYFGSAVVTADHTRPGSTAEIAETLSWDNTNKHWDGSGITLGYLANWTGMYNNSALTFSNGTVANNEASYTTSRANFVATGDVVRVQSSVATLVTAREAAVTDTQPTSNSFQVLDTNTVGKVTSATTRAADTGYVAVMERKLSGSAVVASDKRAVTFTTVAAHGLSAGDVVELKSTRNTLDVSRITVTEVGSSTSFKVALAADGVAGSTTESGTVRYVDAFEVVAGTFTAQAQIGGTDAGSSAKNGTLSAVSASTTIATTPSASVQNAIDSNADGTYDNILVKAGTLSVDVVATVFNSTPAAIGAGRTVKVTTVSPTGTAKVNGKTAAGQTLTTDANGQVTLTVTSLAGAASDAITVTVTPEGVSGAAATFTIDWEAQTYGLYDLNTTNGSALTTGSDPDVTLTVLEDGSSTMRLAVLDQWYAAPADGDYRLKVLGQGTTDGFYNFTNGIANVTITDDDTYASYQVDIDLQKLSGGAYSDVVANPVDVTLNTVAATKVLVGADASTLYSGDTADLSDVVSLKALVEKDNRLENTLAPAYTNFLLVTGQIVNNATLAGLNGAPVTITGPSNILFENGAVSSRGSITFMSESDGDFAVTLYSTTAQSATELTISSLGATNTVKVTFTGQTAGEGSVLTIVAPNNVQPSSSFQVTVNLADALGNGVSTGTDGTIKIVRTGPGIAFGALPVDTDANGNASFSILLGANDTGSITITASYDQNDDGDYVDTKDRTVTKTITVGASADTKVNAGSFKGYVAVYAKGYEGKRLSAKIGNDWVIVPSLASSFERIVDFTGAGVDISVRIYIDRVLLDTIELTTK